MANILNRSNSADQQPASHPYIHRKRWRTCKGPKKKPACQKNCTVWYIIDGTKLVSSWYPSWYQLVLRALTALVHVAHILALEGGVKRGHLQRGEQDTCI